MSTSTTVSRNRRSHACLTAAAALLCCAAVLGHQRSEIRYAKIHNTPPCAQVTVFQQLAHTQVTNVQTPARQGTLSSTRRSLRCNHVAQQPCGANAYPVGAGLLGCVSVGCTRVRGWCFLCDTPTPVRGVHREDHVAVPAAMRCRWSGVHGGCLCQRQQRARQRVVVVGRQHSR